MLTVGILYKEAYGVAIIDEIEQRTNRKVSIGALQTVLRRLESKGYLTSEFGEATNVRGGKRKRYFSLTSSRLTRVARKPGTTPRIVQSNTTSRISKAMNQSSDIGPPKFFLRFFRWFCNPSFAEDIEGDLKEMFMRDAASGNIARARLRFSLNVLRLFRPGIIKRFGNQSSYTNPSPMFRNYFITSVRSLARSKGFSAINIIGLSVGLATFSLIAFYVYHELSFDRYHKNGDRIFRIVENLRTENELLLQSTSSPPMGPTMLKDFPEVEKYVRLQNWNLLVERNGFPSTSKILT